MTIAEQVVANAKSYLGKREKKANSGFEDPEFESEMKEEGWQKGWAWCCVFAKVVYKNVIPTKAKEFDKLFSPSCVQTFKNFENAKYNIHALPRPGYLVLYQSIKEGKPQPTGHAAIVTELISTWEFKSIDGNSNDEGGREGIEVSFQPHKKVLKDVWNGMKVLGFIQPWD